MQIGIKTNPIKFASSYSYFVVLLHSMRRHQFYFVFISLSICFFHAATFAQNGEGEIENQQIIVEKNRKIELPEAQRNYEKIVIEKKTSDIVKQNYSFNDYTLPLPFIDAKLKILSIKDEPLSKLYANYLKAGFGNYGTTYFEGFLYNKRSTKTSYGLNARHFASARGPVKRSGLSDNHLLAYGKYLLPKQTIESDLGYYRTARHFYGYNQDLEINHDTMKQVFNNVLWNLGIKNTDSLASLQYQGTFELSHIRDRFSAKETEGLLRYRTQARLDSSSSYGARGLISVAGRSDQTTYIRNLVAMQPYYQRKWEGINFIGGFNFAYENDTILSKKNFHIYPSLRAEYKVVDGLLNAFAGLDGNMERNTFRTTVRENPWMTDRFTLSHSNKLLDIYLGANGNLFKNFSYQVHGAHLSYKNLPFFINNSLDSLRFNLAYDSNHVRINRLKAEITYNLERKILAGANVTYQSFGMGTLKKPWHMPVMQANYFFIYYFKEKIIFNLNSYMYSGIVARMPKGKEEKLPTILDMNVKVDYLFSQKFSAFLELNNLLANKYQRYLFYSQKGINFLLGATCSF